jgi:hypothetical protein
MKKIVPHKISFQDMLLKCAEGMEQVNVQSDFKTQLPILIARENIYRDLGGNGVLFKYPKIEPLTETTLVVGNLTKSKLINLYENNLRNKNKPARIYYDELLVSSGERCPFCGDIGYTRNLDHFLPKAHFPEFSVMPLNLVPSCRDCNMGEKGQKYAQSEEDQTIHPYLDKDIFFKEQWVFANYIDENEGALNYYVECPLFWRLEDKNRAINHFNNLGLTNRYQLEAGKHLSELIDQKKSFKKMILKISPQIDPIYIQNAFIEANLQPLIDSSKFPNHWKKVMYQCIANSNEFFKDYQLR